MPEEPVAYVRLIEPAVDDLRALMRADPQTLRKVLKKMLLLERHPEAGVPLLGSLIGWRKLVVGDRHWRIVWRVTSDASGTTTIDVAEVWAAGARAHDEVYEEMEARIASLPGSPVSVSLAEVLGLLGEASGRVTPATEPTDDPVPGWLAGRLRHQAGMSASEIESLSPEQAMVVWEAFITRPR